MKPVMRIWWVVGYSNRSKTHGIGSVFVLASSREQAIAEALKKRPWERFSTRATRYALRDPYALREAAGFRQDADLRIVADWYEENGFVDMAKMIRDCRQDADFRIVADWYEENGFVDIAKMIRG